MENILLEYFGWTKTDDRDIFKFYPSSKYSFEENKNSIMRYLLYLSIILSVLTKKYKLVIFFMVCLLFVQIIGSNIISTKKKDDEIVEKKENICRKSTINNPMGNSLLYTPENELDQKLCRFQEKEIDKNLKYNVYYDSKDLFLKKNNIRPFITMPSQTHPNDIDRYKRYIYYFDNPTCKFDAMNCMFNEDIRYHKTNYLEKYN